MSFETAKFGIEGIMFLSGRFSAAKYSNCYFTGILFILCVTVTGETCSIKDSYNNKLVWSYWNTLL